MKAKKTSSLRTFLIKNNPRVVDTAPVACISKNQANYLSNEYEVDEDRFWRNWKSIRVEEIRKAKKFKQNSLSRRNSRKNLKATRKLMILDKTLEMISAKYKEVAIPVVVKGATLKTEGSQGTEVSSNGSRDLSRLFREVRDFFSYRLGSIRPCQLTSHMQRDLKSEEVSNPETTIEGDDSQHCNDYFENDFLTFDYIQETGCTRLNSLVENEELLRIMDREMIEEDSVKGLEIFPLIF